MTNVAPLQPLNMDINQQQGFVRFYRNLPPKTGSTVRIFNHSDYYTVHGEDATLVSQQVFNTSIIKYMGQEPKLSYAVLSRLNFEKLIRELLLIKQYRVEVYTKPSQGKNNDWLLEFKGSPGNLQQFEEILFQNNDVVINSSVMCVKIFKGKMLAISCVNTIEGQFYVTEINDNEFFTELEALIAHIGPKECLIPSSETAEIATLAKVLERNNVLVIKTKKSAFNTKDIIQDLNRLLYFADKQQVNAAAFPETKQTDAMETLQNIIKHLALTDDDKNFNQFKLSSLDIKRFVRLDSAAIGALNLLPKPGELSNKNMSIFGVLDHCSTPQGRRLLDQWLKQPLRDLTLINDRLEIVETLLNDSETRTDLATTALTRFPDLLMLAKKLSTKKITLQDCYRIYQTVYNIPNFLNILGQTKNKSIQNMLCYPISELQLDMEKYQAMIEQTLDMDLVDRGEFLIKPSFDAELQELHKKKQGIEEKMQKLLKRASSDLGFEDGKTLKLEYTDQHGYFFRVTLKEEQALRKNKNYTIIDAVNKGVRFTNDKLHDLNESYSEINKSYEEAQKTVVSELFEIAAGYADTIRNLNLCIAKVDVLVAFAVAAATSPIPYVRPKMLPEGSGVLKLKKARHPCLERIDEVTFIPNDVELNKEDTYLDIITGPNMGGKSTYMRTAGVCVLLAHIGSLVPCEYAEISMVDCILARVGADDCEIKGMSTFMLEMVEACSIVRSATSNSLVIIDELGRGTSTYDGCGIAFSLAEYLAKEVKCFTLFATHFHEITKLAEVVPSVQNLHVTALVNEDSIVPLYQIQEGICDNSYGIHCAKTVGFPNDVIELAEVHQQNLEDYQAMKYIKNYDVGIKRKIVDDGDALLEEALEELKKEAKNLSEDALQQRLKKFKSDLLSKDNLFIKGLLDE